MPFFGGIIFWSAPVTLPEYILEDAVQTADLLILNAYVVTMDPERRLIASGGIAVKDGKIICIDDSATVERLYAADKTIDASGRAVFPGMINTHNHLFQILLKGLGKDMNLFDWLDNSIRRAYPLINGEDIYLAAAAGCIELLKSGVTTVLDYQYAHGKPGLSDRVIDAFLDTGIRGILARGYTETRDFPEECKCELEESETDFFNDALRLSGKYAEHSTVDIALAPGIIWSLSREGYIGCAACARELGTFITLHMLETAEDDAFAQRTYGMTTIEFLKSVGVLDTPLLAVHCAEIKEAEIDVLAQHGVTVSYNAISNMLMGYKTLPVIDLLKRGMTVGLATDGAASNDNQNMLQVLKISALWQKAFYKDPTVMPASKILEMATIDGAAAVFKEKTIGSLEVGKRADMFIYDPMKCSTVPVADPVVSLVYGAGENNIETVIVDGKIVMENGTVVGVDEDDILFRLQAAADSIRKRAGLGVTQWGLEVNMGPFRKR